MRERFGVSDLKIKAANGMYFDSFAETCWVNYLYAHGIKITIPKLYSKEYAEQSGRSYGRYDPGFVATHGEWQGREILVEIFGGQPGGSSTYASVQAAKIKFNEQFDNFLAIDYMRCYSDKCLQDILQPYIGLPERVIYDSILPNAPATMSSSVEDTLKRCQEICDNTPDGLLPALTWFYRTEKYKGRERLEWEPERWHGLVEAISRLGWKEVREKMKRTDAQIAYGRAPTLRNVQDIYDKFNLAPSKLFNKWCHTKDLNEDDKKWFNLAQCTVNACKRLFQDGEKDAIKLLDLSV